MLTTYRNRFTVMSYGKNTVDTMSEKTDSEILEKIRKDRADYHRRWMQKKKAAGYRPSEFWVTSEEREVLRATLDSLRGKDDAA